MSTNKQNYMSNNGLRIIITDWKISKQNNMKHLRVMLY